LNLKTQIYKPPFPWFGGKSKVAHLVWERFGDVPNYVEPFFGSGAVMFLRPHEPGTETVNDKDSFVCVAPQTRVLKENMEWINAGDIAIGDKLLAFDENNSTDYHEHSVGNHIIRHPKSYRKWRIGEVIKTEVIKLPSYRLTFEDGTKIICSENHSWLSCRNNILKKSTKGGKWIKTRFMKTPTFDGQVSRVLKLCNVVDKLNTWDAGWMGGFFDGEGHISSRRTGWKVTVTQRLGIESDRAFNILSAHGFNVRREIVKRKSSNHADIEHLHINGGMRENIRFLMTFRPERLIRNLVKEIHNKSVYGRDNVSVALVEKEYVGEQEVVAIETDCHTYIAEGLASHNCNFWRATQSDSAEVAKHADWPVNETDLLARHKWLIEQGKNGFVEKMRTDPYYFDAKIAGWWVWGICCWIGQGWCKVESQQLPHLGDQGRGINRKLPHLGDQGQGINRKLPHLGDQGQGIAEYLESLSQRLRRVRVACGDWKRVLGDSVTFKHGVTGIFLDPPYSHDERDELYSVDENIAVEVKQWAIENGNNKLLRIALCGYDTEHEMPADWSKVHWKTNGGFSNQGDGSNKNKYRETIWFSPYCLNKKQQDLF